MVDQNIAGNIKFSQATVNDLPLLSELLQANSLPDDDLIVIFGCLTLARLNSELIGFGGLEQTGRFGLLRSLVTSEEFRGCGYGRAIVAHLIEQGREKHIESIYLLTFSAESFFARLGFAVVDRSVAPESIHNTSEFKFLCPDSAVCMCLMLR